MSSIKLPALPVPIARLYRDKTNQKRWDSRACSGDDIAVYSAQYMCAYAEEAVLADRERQAGEAVAWMPIETAPKDGTEFVVRYTMQGNVKRLIRWNIFHGHWESKGEAVIALELQKVEWAMLPSDSSKSPVIVSGAVSADDANLRYGDAYGVAWVYASLPAPQAVQADIRPNSVEASAMMDSVLAEYGWPTNPKNAARAGFEACRRMLAAVPQSLIDAVLRWHDPKGDSMGACANLNKEIANWLAAAPSPDGKAEQAEAPSDYPQFLLRKCEHCGCETNAKMRACCKAGWVDDKVASEDRASLATQPTASNAGERGIDDAFDVARAALVRQTTLPEIRHVLDVLKTRVRAALATKPPAGEQKPTCMCGEPWVLNTVHRENAPCWRAADPVDGLDRAARARGEGERS